MSKLYVCEEYETLYEEGYRVITTLEEHDKKIRVDAIDEFINKFIKRTHLRQMTKAECISTMYDIAYEIKEQKQIEFLLERGMGFRCFNGTNNCDYCGSCHAEFKARTSDEKRRIYNQALEDFMDKLPYSAMVRMSTLKEIVKQLKKQNFKGEEYK